MKIRKEIENMLDELTRMRQALHQHPEIGFDTYETMRYVQEQIPIKAVECDGFSGTFYLKGQVEACLGFRCELDGLPITEQSEVSYASQNAYMHACGHDAHMAIQICTIRYFLEHPPICSLLFIFQPAEESGSGAKHMMRSGIFEKYAVKQLYALHVYPGLGLRIGCRSGVLMAQSCEMIVRIEGKSAHAAHADQGIDAMKVMCCFLEWVDELKKDLLPNLLHFGKCESGSVCNAVAAKSQLWGTLRSFDEKQFGWIKQAIENKLKNLDDAYHTTTTISFSQGYERVVNDERMAHAIQVIADEDYVEMGALQLSEDFSFYRHKCPCCMYLCGLSTQADLHAQSFDLREEECLKAIEMNVQLVAHFCEMM